MEQSASIHLKDSRMDIHFEWSNYDGYGECFNNFQILVNEGNQSEHFDFGECVIFGLRKLSKFFRDVSQATAGLGFRNPDIRYCDIYRDGKDYRLVIKYEGSNLHKEFTLNQPVINLNDKFLESYGS